MIDHLSEPGSWADAIAHSPWLRVETFAAAATGERGFDAVKGGGETHPAAFAPADRSFHSATTTPGGQPDHG